MDRRQLLKFLGLSILLPVPTLAAKPNKGQRAQYYRFDVPLTEATFVTMLHNHRNAGCIKPTIAEMNAIAIEDLVASTYPSRTFITNPSSNLRPLNSVEPMLFYYPGGQIEIKVFLDEDLFYDRSHRHLCLRAEYA